MIKLVVAAGVLSLALLVLVAGFNIRIFVVQPIGALPDGGAVVLHSRPNLQLVDSPDAICWRTQRSVTLFCRAAALGVIGDGETILFRLPYSPWLYALSGAPEVEG